MLWPRRELIPDIQRLGVGLYLLGLASSLGGIAAESLLIGRGGTRFLPLAIFLKPASVLVATMVYLRLTRGVRPARPFVVTAVLAAIAGAGFGTAAARGTAVAAPAFACTVYTMSAMGLIHFHNVRGRVLDAVAAKEVLPRVLACLSLGSLTGGLASLAIGRLPETSWGLLYAALALAAGFAQARPFADEPAEEANAEPAAAVGGTAAGKPAPSLVPAGAVTLLGQPLARWLLISGMLIVVVERGMELTAGRFLAQLGGPKAVSQVLSWFTVLGAIFSVSFEAFIVSALMARLGAARTALVYPLSCVGLAGLAAACGGLTAALAARACHTILPTSCVDPVYNLLDGGLPPVVIRQLRTFKNGMLKPASGMLFAMVASQLPAEWALPVAGVCAAMLSVRTVRLPALYAASWLASLSSAASGRHDLRTARAHASAAEQGVGSGEVSAVRRLRARARCRTADWASREQALLGLSRSPATLRLSRTLMRSEARRALALARHAAALPPGRSTGVSLVRMWLEDRAVDALYLSVRAASLERDEVFFDTVFDGLRSPDGRVRSSALEALSSHAPGPLPPELFDLVSTCDYLSRRIIGSNLQQPRRSATARKMQGLYEPGANLDSSWADGYVWLPAGLIEGGAGPRSHAAAAAEAPAAAAAMAQVASDHGPWAFACAAWARRELGHEVPTAGPKHPVIDETLAWLASPRYPEGMPTIARLAILKGSELFVGFSSDELARVAEAARIEHYAAGDVLLRAGVPATQMFLIVKGTVRVEPAPGGASADLGAEQIVGELGLFDPHPNAQTVTALEPVEALTLSRSDVSELVTHQPALSLAFLGLLSARLRAALAGGPS